MKSGWMVMLHGAATLGWDAQAGPRGGHEVLSTNYPLANRYAIVLLVLSFVILLLVYGINHYYNKYKSLP